MLQTSTGVIAIRKEEDQVTWIKEVHNVMAERGVEEGQWMYREEWQLEI
jgi:hypothetical protein